MIICPKCRHARQPDESAPDWQCPSGGVAYAKAANAWQSSNNPSAQRRPKSAPAAWNIPWGKLILLAAVVWGGWTGLHMARAGHTSGSGIVAATDSDSSASELSTLAATVKPGEVVMYSTTECPYCTQAKAWLNQYGFAFTECNIGINTVCEEEFRRYGATGTPYLVVQRNGKQRHMKDGFDSDEFLAALQ